MVEIAYDTYYQTEDLFGEPYPELVDFFRSYSHKGKVLDLGCGQGRDAIAIARLGFEVTGIDTSEVGINQMLKIAQNEGLPIIGQVADIYLFDNFQDFDFIIFDSIFHFYKKDIENETKFIKKVIDKAKKDSVIIFCIHDTNYKVEVLNTTIDSEKKIERVLDLPFDYKWNDEESGQESKTDYRMVAIKK